MSNTRIYKVKTPTGIRLVDAVTKSQAINHCVDADYSAEPVSASEMYSLIQAGAKVEKAVVREKKGEPSSSSPAPAAPVPTPASVTPAILPAAPQASAGVTSGPSVSTPSPDANKQPAPFIPPAPATAGQFTPPGHSSNPVIAEQQRINPNAAAAAGAPAPVIPIGAAPAPKAGAVDWEAREQGQGG